MSLPASENDALLPSALCLNQEHRIFRQSARRFFEEECAPHREEWESAGLPPRAIWKRSAELGFLCPRVAEDYGGMGADFLFGVVLLEEQARAGVVAPMLSLHSDVVAPYLVHYGTEEQRARLLPQMVSGDCIGAIGISEPSAGSDVQSIRTTARRDGDDYLISGQKTFISNGICADLIVLAAKTDAAAGARGISLFLIETGDLPRFRRGRNLKKLGQKSADTAELFFDEVRVPASSLLGGVEGRGFPQLMERLVEERLLTAVAAMGAIERALHLTLQYVKDRRAFGQRILDFQNTRFKLADAKTEATVLRVFLDRCIRAFMEGTLDASTSAALKYWATEQQCAIIDACVQLHGGYGYILDFPIARMWTDARVTRIYGGANEIMKDIVGRSL